LQSAGTTAITVDTSQNVGIGTASPPAKLSSHGADTTPQLNLYGSSTGSLGANFTYKTSSGDLYMATNGVNSSSAPQMVLSASGNVGINTTAMSGKFNITDNTGGSGLANTVTLTNGVDSNCYIKISGSSATDKQVQIGPSTGTALAFQTNATERMRIDSTGRFWSGNASPWTVGSGGANCWALYNGGDFPISAASQSTITAIFNRCNSTGTIVEFKYNAGANGSVSTNGTNVAYNTSSDYRLKENIAPMTSALAKVAQLKPVTYKWKINGSDGEGFIAHELAEVCPQAVHGTKDEVDAEGNPVYQGVDTSFLVATLTAAIQEQQATITAQAETINALTARIVALEARA
jgi:hypothetical protein